jgi:hypothetical protein
MSDKPSDADIKAKIEVFRAALAKARKDLAAARKDLESAVTPKQDAILIALGILE